MVVLRMQASPLPHPHRSEPGGETMNRAVGDDCAGKFEIKWDGMEIDKIATR